MADQGHNDGIGHTSVLEQRNCRVAQTVEAQVYSCTFAPLVLCPCSCETEARETASNKQLAELVGERSDSSILRENDLGNERGCTGLRGIVSSVTGAPCQGVTHAHSDITKDRRSVDR